MGTSAFARVAIIGADMDGRVAHGFSDVLLAIPRQQAAPVSDMPGHPRALTTALIDRYRASPANSGLPESGTR